jgi:hypothetical protein
MPPNIVDVDLIFQPRKGPIAEPPLDDKEFLNGFIDYGVWIRVIAADQAAATLRGQSASPLERLAAVTTFYEQVGKQLEDIASNIIAWSLWRLDRTKHLADILNRVAIFFGPAPSPPEPHVRAIHERFLERPDMRLRVDARAYLTELAEAWAPCPAPRAWSSVDSQSKRSRSPQINAKYVGNPARKVSSAD